MMYFLDLTNPLVLLAALMLYSLLMILGKEFKKSALPAISLIVFLAALGIYTFEMFATNNLDINKWLATCIGYDSILVLLSFISYLWVDSIEAKAKNKKSIDNSLEWFWDKV